MEGIVTFHKYHGEEAITFSFGGYTAMILPEIGGNLVSFIDTVRGLSFLRTPKEEEMDAFKSRPFVYGIPVLFPPNRYENGTFSINGRTYHFPINEEETHNHIHGFFYDIPWEIVDSGTSSSSTYVTLSQNIDENHSVYRYWPHRFQMTLRYRLSNEGLTQDVRVDNLGPDPMPFMLAFHTTINVPFAQESKVDDYTYTATIGERWELSERMLPTGTFESLSEGEQRIKNGGMFPFFEEMDNHYTARPQNGVNFMALTDHHLGIRLIYNVGAKYNNWMIWNNLGRGDFFCPEPQTNVVNAPNTRLSNEESGLIMLEPGGSWFETSHFTVEEV